MAKLTQRFFIVGGSVLLCVVALFYWQRSELRDWYRMRNQEPMPEEKTMSDFVNVPVQNTNTTNNDVSSDRSRPVTTSSAEEPIVLPETINLAIPFTAQAPTANWDLPYQEACEEASQLMAGRFLQNRNITDPDDADHAILELVDYNTTTLQYPIDMTAEETAHSMEEFYQLNTELIYDFSWDDVKRALAQGYPVLLPAAGRQLGNPYYTAPGPLYHMVVIKGYTTNKIITNDPGTKRGTNYQYSYDTLYAAAHDWNGGNVQNGRKVIIIVKPK